MMAEWLNAADCKFVLYKFIGSNPIHCIFYIYYKSIVFYNYICSNLSIFFYSFKIIYFIYL